MRCFLLLVLAAAIPDPRGWFRPRPDRVEVDVARAHNPSSREDEPEVDSSYLDTRVIVDANGVDGAEDSGEEPSELGFLEGPAEDGGGEPTPPAAAPAYDMNNPAGYCVVDRGGVPLCCRRVHEDCTRNISMGGCRGLGGIGKDCVKDCKSGENDDFCFLIHGDASKKPTCAEGAGAAGAAGVADVFCHPDIEMSSSTEKMALHVVWDSFDPWTDSDLLWQLEGDSSTLRSWTAWLKHVIPPVDKWLNPPGDPDPQMFWCIQQGLKRCTKDCTKPFEAKGKSGSASEVAPTTPESETAGSGGGGVKVCVQLIQSIPPDDPPSAAFRGKK